MSSPTRSTAYGARHVDPVRDRAGGPHASGQASCSGVIIIYRHEVRPFADSQIALMETFADQAAIAIENARLLSELQTKNADLTVALEQQTATSEILRVISSSPTDEQPVFDAIVQSARRLCEATLQRGLSRRRRASSSSPPSRVWTRRGSRPSRRPTRARSGRDTTSGRAILDRRVVHLEDTLPRSRVHPSATRYHRAAIHSDRPHLSGRAPHRRAHRLARGGATFHRQADHAAADVRRPGGDRAGERPPVHRAERAQRRAAGRARAADRDQRAAQGDRAVHVRSPAGLRDARRERGAAVRGRAGVHLPLRRPGAASCRWPSQSHAEFRSSSSGIRSRPGARALRRAPRWSAARSTFTTSRPIPSTPRG